VDALLTDLAPADDAPDEHRLGVEAVVELIERHRQELESARPLHRRGVGCHDDRGAGRLHRHVDAAGDAQAVAVGDGDDDGVAAGRGDGDQLAVVDQRYRGGRVAAEEDLQVSGGAAEVLAGDGDGGAGGAAVDAQAGDDRLQVDDLEIAEVQALEAVNRVL